jgi:putative oxidoreductase
MPWRSAHAPRGPWPILNEGELALLYAFLFLYVSGRGAGLISVDAFLTRARTHSLPLDPKPV